MTRVLATKRGRVTVRPNPPAPENLVLARPCRGHEPLLFDSSDGRCVRCGHDPMPVDVASLMAALYDAAGMDALEVAIEATRYELRLAGEFDELYAEHGMDPAEARAMFDPTPS